VGIDKMKRLAQALFAMVVIGIFAGATVRTWKDKSGKYDMKAELVKYENGRVYLKRESDGKTISLSMSTLSRYDQIWVNKEMDRRRTGGDRPKPPADTPEPDEAPSAPSGQTDWPQWRGPNRDGKSAETGLLTSWPADGPRKLWSASGLGRGYASVAVVGDRIYTMGRRGNGESLICLAASSGETVWTAAVGSGDHSNCTPTVDGNRVYGIGLKGDLVCVDTTNGQVIWQKNFARDFGGQMMSQWGFSESPLVDGDKLVCTPGGSRSMMVALNKETGLPIWATQMPPVQGNGKDGAGYSSAVISLAGGAKQYVQLVGRGLIGVNADNGKLLWGYNKIANDTANIPTPIAFSNYAFCSSGYNAGSALLKVSGGEAQEVYFLPHNQLQVHHGGMILHQGHIFCGHGQSAGYPTCLDLKTGRLTWERGRGPGKGSAAVTYADGHIYFRYEDGIMALVEANPAQFRLKGRFQIATVNDKSWPHPVISDGKLYLRDQDNLHCYDIRQ
jgi:outer membrane protein assembly factor BamB